jgi:hypothetical protein
MTGGYLKGRIRREDILQAAVAHLVKIYTRERFHRSKEST